MINILKIYLVQTNLCCFITDCLATSGYDYQYHRSKIDNLYFDGEIPEKTFYVNWLKIKRFPFLVQEMCTQPSINERYEIIDKNLICDKLPEIIEYESRNDFQEEVLSLYKYTCDKQEPVLKDIEYEIETIFEIDNFEYSPIINYPAIRTFNYATDTFNITNCNIQHQIFDKMLFPEVVLSARPCSISSQQLYQIVRAHITNTIDNKCAKITSNYDFCFTVKKVVPLLAPERISYTNLFARTKKERNQIKFSVKEFKEFEIFEMTHDQSKYQNYSVIPAIFAENEEELKNKIDEFLETLMEIINKPLSLCPHCNGTGYDKQLEKIDKNKIIESL